MKGENVAYTELMMRTCHPWVSYKEWWSCPHCAHRKIMDSDSNAIHFQLMHDYGVTTDCHHVSACKTDVSWQNQYKRSWWNEQIGHSAVQDCEECCWANDIYLESFPRQLPPQRVFSKLHVWYLLWRTNKLLHTIRTLLGCLVAIDVSGGLRFNQMNKAICEGLSETISTVSDGKIRSTVSMQKEEGRTNKQNTCHVHFGVNKMGLLALRYGIFDYNRHSQWMLLLMIDTIWLSE